MNDVPKWMWEDDHSVFRDHVGYGPIVWRENYVELALALDERHRNRSGIAHGGVIATLIDAAGGFAGCWCPHRDRIRRASTLSLNTQFVSPGRLGHRLITTGRARAGGKSIFFSTMVSLVLASSRTLAMPGPFGDCSASSSAISSSEKPSSFARRMKTRRRRSSGPYCRYPEARRGGGGSRPLFS